MEGDFSILKSRLSSDFFGVKKSYYLGLNFNGSKENELLRLLFDLDKISFSYFLGALCLTGVDFIIYFETVTFARVANYNETSSWRE
jgi:hypothetical protein